MTVSVGTIETYVSDSIKFNQTQYSDLGTQDRESLSLSDSNLWLVDSTTLNQDNTTELTLLNLDSTSSTTDTQGYLAPVGATSMISTTGDITVYGSDPTADSVLYPSGSSLQLSEGTPLLEVQGGTQGSATLFSSDGSGSSSTTLADFGTVSGSGTTTSGAGSSPSGTSADGSSITEGESDTSIGADGSSGTAIIGETDGTVGGPDDVKDVPFEPHSALGLLTIGAIVVIRRGGWWRRSQSINPV